MALYKNDDLHTGVQVSQAIASMNLESHFYVEVIECLDFGHVFSVLNRDDADFVAILSPDNSVIENSFEYLNQSFQEKKPVSMALYFAKDKMTVEKLC